MMKTMIPIQAPSRLAQCRVCRQDMSECPHYEQDATTPCSRYERPIDNSRFFGHFFSTKGRIGRLEYLVTTVIGVALALVISMNIGFWYALLTGGDSIDNTTATIIGCVACIPLAVLIVIAGIKRCHDSGTDIWYAFVPAILLYVLNLILIVLGVIAVVYLFFQKGDEGINAHGTEPGKPYDLQIAEAIEQYQNEETK